MNGLMPIPTLADIPDNAVAIVVCFLIFGGGGVLARMFQNMNATRIEMARLRAEQKGNGNVSQELAAVREEIAALRKQVNSLSDTATQYDLSFDTALQHMDSRVGHLERKVLTQSTTVETPQNVTLGSR